MRNKLKALQTKYLSAASIGWLALILSFNMTVYIGARVLNANRTHYDISLWIDGKIPFLPATILIYLGCYLFWAANYILAVAQGGYKARQFAFSDLLGKAVCLVIYLAFPTTMQRADITHAGIWQPVIQFVYSADAPDNLFPSIHCLVSWFCYLGIRDIDEIPTWYKRASAVMAICVFISTLTVKQHVVVDVFAGWLLAEAAYRICHRRTGREHSGEHS